MPFTLTQFTEHIRGMTKKGRYRLRYLTIEPRFGTIYPVRRQILRAKKMEKWIKAIYVFATLLTGNKINKRAKSW
jgi:hypothetical protein